MAASFALGIFLVGSGGVHWFMAAALPVWVGVCLLAGLLVLRAGWQRVSLLLALAGFLAAGASAACLFQYRFPPNHVSKLAARGVDLADPIRLQGQVVSNPIRTAYGVQFDLETAHVEEGERCYDLSGKVRLRILASENPQLSAPLDALNLQYGDVIRVLARLRKPRIYQNPGSFDFRRWMESTEDIYWIGTIKNSLLVEKLPGSGHGGIRTLVERIRSALLRSIDDLYPRWSAQGRYGTVLKAVLFGDRSSLDSETIENFRKTGLYHLLVIAGLHVGLLVLLVSSLLRLFPLGERSRGLMVLAFLMFYSVLVEQRAPTLRATLMISLYLLGRLLYRGHSALNAIGLAALILLLFRPAWLFESGFQLSFSAALLIAGLVAPILERTTEPYRHALENLDEKDLDARLAPKQAQFRLDLRALIAGLRKRSRFLDAHGTLAGAVVTGPARLMIWTANILLFSAVLQVGLLLPMATTFHRVAFAGIGFNALAIPLMTLLLALALPTVLLGALLPTLAHWPAQALGMVMAGLFALTDLPHLPGWLSFRVPNPPLWVGCAFALSILAAALSLAGRREGGTPSPGPLRLKKTPAAGHPLPQGGEGSQSLNSRPPTLGEEGSQSSNSCPLSLGGEGGPQHRVRGLVGHRVMQFFSGNRAWVFWVSMAALALATALVALHPFSPRLPSGILEVTALDCGQGDSLFLVLPDKTTMLVDASGSRNRSTSEGAYQGRRWDPGEDIVSPYLWSRGIKKINIVVLSHPHEDHLGGLFAIMRNFQIGEFWHAANSATPAYSDLLEVARQKHVKQETLAAGEELERGGAAIRVLWPARSQSPASFPSNDDSLVLHLTYHGASVLLPGDISSKVERELLASGEPLESQLLKVAHHGSHTSTSLEFLARVNPRLAIITGGSGDFGNLPSPETLERLREREIRVFRSDVDGATTVEIQNGSLAVRCCARRHM
jgi:ComEC/Rec2-related protein